MPRIYNYAAFYVSEPFNASSLGANATRDFVYYNLLRSWKGADSSFPFLDAHSTNYSVRDSSDWDLTLKPRLRERIRSSKNIILFLSNSTVSSRALREEIEYGVGDQRLPVIAVYPEVDEVSDISVNGLTIFTRSRISRLPVFERLRSSVPVLHVPMDKRLIKNALSDGRFSLGSSLSPGDYWFNR